MDKNRFFFEHYGLTERGLESYLAAALSAGGDYADLYFQYSRLESWSLEEGIVKSGSYSIDRGVGVRAVADEKTAYDGALLLYQAQIAAVDASDQAQEKARAAAPLSTKARNIILRRILDAVDSIAGAGIIAFANSPTERASFEALIKKAK